ncbi:hypothetical protein PIB30_058795 [Stylosanthes scabra]|uniref:ELM2 domain-containing protein n=1 Tax=Stylosanthes scabra TaxID=79078 RepID=A0ABU6XJW2_9FABA|nr:hypothetical protein [Stylosanthes scabra]
MTSTRKVHGVNNGKVASSESSIEDRNRHLDVDTRVCVLNQFILDESILAEYGEKGVDNDDDATELSSEDFDVEDNKSDGDGDCDSNAQCGKRKRDTISSELLSWVKNFAVNPRDDSKVGLISNNKNPKWKTYGPHDDDEMVWKKVLLYREAAYSNKRVRSSSSEQEFCKIQKMCPLFYDGEPKKDGIYNLRKKLKNNYNGRFSTFSIQTSSDSSYSDDDDSEEEEEYTSKKLLNNSPKEDSFFYQHIRAKHVPVGSSHQAVVPKWNGRRRGTASLESDSKWLGTRIWPSKHAMNPRVVVERDPIGKGRQDSCGCPEPGLVDCVRFHVAEKRNKLKLQLGKPFE